MLDILPNELLVLIFLNLPISKILQISSISKKIYKVCQDEYLWRQSVNRDFDLNKKPNIWSLRRWSEIYKFLYTWDSDTLASYSTIFGEIELLKKALTRHIKYETMAWIMITAATHGNYEIIEMIPYYKVNSRDIEKAANKALKNNHSFICSYLEIQALGHYFNPPMETPESSNSGSLMLVGSHITTPKMSSQKRQRRRRERKNQKYVNYQIPRWTNKNLKRFKNIKYY